MKLGVKKLQTLRHHPAVLHVENISISTSSSVTAERPRDFKGVGHFEAKFYIYGPLDRGIVIDYNFAAGSFTQRNFVYRRYSIETEFYSKNKNRFLSHIFGDLGVTYALHL